MQQSEPSSARVYWQYLTVYLSGALDFPDSVDRPETLKWASKAISHQLNEYAARGWEVLNIRWLSDVELMVIFKRSALPPNDSQNDEEANKSS